jgi:hypothetical protein
MRNRFGMLNERHREALPQIGQPAVLTRFLGEEGLRESGLEATWLPPLPFYLEVLGGVFNGDNEESFGGGSLRDPLLTGRVRTFWELGATSAVQLGASVASAENEDGRRTTLVGADVKCKLTPEGWQHSVLTVAGEALYSSRRLQMEDEATGISSSVRRDRYGWYAYAEIQPWRRWLFGARYDWTEFPVDPGREWAVEPYIAFMPSEFLRFRLAYKHTERSREIGGEEAGSRGRIVDELLLQATFFLGAHPAHPF